MDADVIVVGAGVAGLAAAYQLSRSGLDCLVLERLPFVGGRMSSERVGGFVIDRGAYTLSGYARRTLELAEMVGCSGSVARLTSRAGAYRGGRVHEYRSDNLLGMAFGSGLSPAEMLAGLKVVRHAASQEAHLRLHQPDERTYLLDGESAADYLSREVGGRLLEKVAYPMISALYISDPEHTSNAAFLASLRYVAGLRLYNSPNGIGFLCDELAKRVRVSTGTEVTRVAPEGGSVVVETRTAPEHGACPLAQSLRARVAICTSTAAEALKLVEGLDERFVEQMGQVHYCASTPVALGLDRPVPGTAFSVSLPRSAFSLLAAVTNESNKHRLRVPDGKGLIMAYPTAEAGRRFLDLEDSEIESAVIGEVERVYPRTSGHVEFCRIYRWPLACSQLRPGDVRKRTALRDAMPKGGPVFFAGDYLTSSSSIEGSVVSGQAAAKAVAGHLAG